MQVKLDKTSLSQTKLMLDGVKDGFPKVFSRALNKTAANTKTAMVTLVRRDYNYKAAALRKRISINKATYANLTASIKSTGTNVHMTDITGTRQTKKGVSVNVKKSTGIKLIPRAFKASGRQSGKDIIFRRPGDPRGQHAKLYGRYGPPGSGGKTGSRARLDTFSAPHPEIVYNTPENWAKLQKDAGEKLNTNFAHEVDVVLKGIA
jgi:hypothetical protein